MCLKLTPAADINSVVQDAAGQLGLASGDVKQFLKSEMVGDVGSSVHMWACPACTSASKAHGSQCPWSGMLPSLHDPACACRSPAGMQHLCATWALR